MCLFRSDLFNQLCKLSLINVHLLALVISMWQKWTKIFETIEIFFPSFNWLLWEIALCWLLFDEFELLHGNVIFIVSCRLVLFCELYDVTEIRKIRYLSGVGLSYFFMKTAGTWAFSLSLSCMVWYFLRIKVFYKLVFYNLFEWILESKEDQNICVKV